MVFLSLWSIICYLYPCQFLFIFFFLFWAKQRLLLKEQTKKQREHPPTKHSQLLEEPS